jgi:hypothetical protein
MSSVIVVAQLTFLLLFLFSLYCIFSIFQFLFCCLSYFFVGFYLPAMIWSDLEEEIVDGGCSSALLWFSVVLACNNHFTVMVVLLASNSSRNFFAIYTALCGLGISPAYL